MAIPRENDKTDKNTTNHTKPAAHPELEAHSRAEALFASIGEGVIATDENGIITQVNHVALDILGYTYDELIGKWFPDKISAVHANGSPISNFDRPITKAFVTGKTISERVFYTHRNNTIIPVALTVSPIMLHDRPIGAIQVFRDITIELENDKMKTDFISIASHQLRTPLSAINMYTHMLNNGLAGPLTDVQQTFLGTILQAATRMNHLINALLNITRIEAGSIVVDPQPCRLDLIASEIVAEHMFEAEEKGITLKLKPITGTHPDINTDALFIREIYTNLLSNAIKYTPENGSVTVSLTTSHGNVVFCVTDTGYGVPKKDQSRIFTKFYRAENISKQDVSGTGLGLYLIKVLAERLGGEVWFTSTENKGSRFYFSLPTVGSLKLDGQFRLET